jgi:hypothetical protein
MLRMQPRSTAARVLIAIVAVLGLGLAVPAFGKAAAAPAGGTGTAASHFGDGNIPAGCILDRDEANPDNKCFHMKVGLNALDSPTVNVAVLVPVSPFAERDMRIMRQAVEMWDGGLHKLSKEMNLGWLSKGVKFNVTTKLVPVDANGLPTQAINLVKPKIVVIATNPVGGIGIGIDPVAFVGELGLTGESGAPCGSIPNPFSMMAWEARPGFDAHHGEGVGGTYVQQCDGPGGQVCFSVNGAVDPVPGVTDFFSIYDLVAHETGHCLTLGHVGDGADGPWGPTPTNDIMAYSSDPVDVSKCVSTLDVEGFALTMSHYLDVNGDGKVDGKDVLKPNDVKGDDSNSFQLQNPKDHWYASSTGEAEDCPQPDLGALPLAEETDWQPAAVASKTATLKLDSAKVVDGKVTWSGTVAKVAKDATPGLPQVSVNDESGDGTLPMTDITGFTASLTKDAVKATIKLDSLWPTTEGGRVTGYGLYVGGRKFDSFVITQGTSSDVQTIDSGARYIMPPGTSTWDTANSTVSFTIPRSYLASQRVLAPYKVFAETGVHIRTKDWVTSFDRAPQKGSVTLGGPAMTTALVDAPVASAVTKTTLDLKHPGGNSFTPADTTTYGLPLVPVVGTLHQVTLPITKQATAKVTLTWDDPASALGMEVHGGSGQIVKSDASGVTITVPWAHRDLSVLVIPSQVMSSEVNYTLKAELTTVIADKDKDGTPDIVDVCASAAGPILSGGCPDTDHDGVLDRNDGCITVAGLRADGCPTANNDKVVAYLDGKQVASTFVSPVGTAYAFTGSAPADASARTLKLVWMTGDTVQANATKVLKLPLGGPPAVAGPDLGHLPATGSSTWPPALALLALVGALVVRRTRRGLAQ